LSVFEIQAGFQPTGDQPAAIEKLSRQLFAGVKHNVLLGVTGSGKTFTMAHVIARLNRPTLVIAPNKTLAAQLYHEFRLLFPANAVEILRELLRLLPAGGVYPIERYLHRQRQLHQRHD